MPGVVRFLAGTIVTAAVVGLAGLALVGDLLVVGLPVPLSLLETRVLLALAVAIFGTSLLLYVYYLAREDASTLVDGGPAIEAVVPVYSDAAAMHRSVEGLAASPYEDLTVTIVPEPDDEPSVRRARELADAHDRVRVRLNRERQGSKAGAINLAVTESDADAIALFDADQRPHEQLLPHAVATLEDADVARVRSIPDPAGGWLESMAYYEYLFLFFLPQKLGKALLDLEVVGTRSVLLDAEVFETVGLLDEDHMTEDYDFTHRCHRAGLTIRELDHYPCFEEPPHSLRDWWFQRDRWMTGHVRVGHDQVRNAASGLSRQSLESAATLVGTFAGGVVMSVTLPKLALATLTDPPAVAAGLGALYAIALATATLDRYSASLPGYGVGWLLLPAALSLYGLVIVQAILGYAFDLDREWYHVEKTG